MIFSYRKHRYLVQWWPVHGLRGIAKTRFFHVCCLRFRGLYLTIFMFSAHFMGYSAHFPVLRRIFSYRTYRYMVWEASQKLVFFMISASISMGYSSRFSCFVAISWAIAHIIRLLGRFPTIVTTDTWFERHHKNCCFSCFLRPFP
jgi:hypothetical protein